MREHARDLVVQRVGLGEVHQTDRAPPHLVFIGGADSALGGADLDRFARQFLAVGVEFPMQRQNQRRVFGDLEIGRRNRDALLAQALDLAHEKMRVHDDAIADDR